MNLPDYIIIGETKCGTTSFFNYLIQHPQILDTYGNGDEVDSAYRTKEIRFFDRYFDRGLDWYKSCFPETGPGQITGEATPMYMYRTTALRRIHKMLPKIKLIVQLRNPIDRLYSNYMHNHKWVPGWTDKYTSFRHFLDSAHDVDYYLIDKGLYAQTLKRWFEYFPRKQFFIFTKEELAEDAQKVYSAALNFLNVAEYQLPLFKQFRKNEYPPMEEEIRRELVEFYRPYNAQLESLLKRPLNWDC